MTPVSREHEIELDCARFELEQSVQKVMNCELNDLEDAVAEVKSDLMNLDDLLSRVSFEGEE